MPDPATLATIRAAVDTILPRTELMPGAVDLEVEDHVVALVEQGLPGAIDMIVALLDAYANDVRAGAAFAELSLEERDAVLRAMSTDESQDIRDVVDGLIVFTLGGAFSEWSGFDRASGKLNPPPSWSVVGFHGPAHAHPDYREDA